MIVQNGNSLQALKPLNGHYKPQVDEDEPNDYDHFSANLDTPMRADAFARTEGHKMELIEGYFEKIMQTLGLDLQDDSLRGTPHRVSKMFVQEIFSGLNPANKPAISVFENKFQYKQMLVEKNIHVSSTCEHHFLPIFGKAHIAYIPKDKVIGLSKLNRIVDYYARRPQVQERLTNQIAEELKQSLNTEDVAVLIDARHLCVMSRGIKDIDSATVTSSYSGAFEKESMRGEFLKQISM